MGEHLLRVHNRPADVDANALAHSDVLVIDVLRATTTICQALASGAREVLPFREIDEALDAAASAGRGHVVLGGERGGLPIDRFDLGNSPAEYTAQAVGGRRVLITTTNGTRALAHARLARRIVLGAFVNLSAVVASLKSKRRIEILCAGTDGDETEEDVLAAGALVDGLCTAGAGDWLLNDAAATARDAWRALVDKSRAAGRSIEDTLAGELRHTRGGRNLIEVGLEGDLADCARIDRLDVVPRFDVQQWRITAG
jgi:2-phosphosulfolactate phosphatase